MTKKRWLLLSIILFPSVLWPILESSTINSRKLPHYGPGSTNAKGDSVFYEVTDRFYNLPDTSRRDPAFISFDTQKYPLFSVMFISKQYQADSYRLAGLWEYLKYSKEKVEHIPFLLVVAATEKTAPVYEDLKKLSESKNVMFATWPQKSFDSLTHVFFKGKPYYIDYSFFMLIDSKRNVRGYYDGRYVAEIKRLAGEYQHLRLKEEKQKLIKENEITTKN